MLLDLGWNTDTDEKFIIISATIFHAFIDSQYDYPKMINNIYLSRKKK